MDEVALGDDHEPNPNYGKLSLKDYILFTYAIGRVLFWDFPKFLVSYQFVYYGKSDRSFGTNAFKFLTRQINDALCSSFNAVRALAGSAEFYAAPILASPRFSKYAENIYKKVSRPTFTGFWILQGGMSSRQSPRDSDVVIFYLHGGGYSTCHPAMYTVFLLRLTESLINMGLSVSLFALDYRLAPEHQFPAQLEDTMAAYDYLLNEMQIPAEKIMLAGDSAGGHLALSFMVNLDKPTVPKLKTKSDKIPKPGSLLILSPWVNILRDPAEFKSTDHIDVCTPHFLWEIGLAFSGSLTMHEAKSLPYVEFTNPNPPIDWDAVLPEWTWITAGAHEILFPDIKRWVDVVEKSGVGKGRVVFDVEPQETHVWQWLETMDDTAKAAYLKGEDVEFRGIEKMAKVVGDRVKQKRARN